MIWGEAELFLGIWGAKAKYFQGDENIFSGLCGDKCIFLRSKGAQPPGGPHMGSDVGQIFLTASKHRDHSIIFALVCEKE